MASGTPEEKRTKSKSGPLKGIRRRESEYAAKTPVTDAIAVETTARTTLFHREWSRLPVSTCWKLTSEKWGHSSPQLALLSIEANKSQSIGTTKTIPKPASARWVAVARTTELRVAGFSGGISRCVGAAGGRMGARELMSSAPPHAHRARRRRSR